MTLPLRISTFGTERPGMSLSKMIDSDMAVCQHLVPLVNIKIAGKWMFIPLKMVLIGIDPYPYPLEFDIAIRRCHTCIQQVGNDLAVKRGRSDARRGGYSYVFTFNAPASEGFGISRDHQRFCSHKVSHKGLTVT